MEITPFDQLGLSEPLLKAVHDLGFEKPSPIQAQSIPIGLEGRDLVGQSQTGSGKTMAFALPAIQRINAQSSQTQVLVLCPTRELAMQVCSEIHKVLTYLPNIKATPVYGGASYDRQIKFLKAGSQIVVGTPGRVLDFISRGTLVVDNLQCLVFDEADEMLDMGFSDDIDTLMKALPSERQTIFFSATFEPNIKRLIEKYTRNAAHVTISHKELTVPTVEQRYHEVQGRSKTETLCRVLDMENPRLTMVFCNTKRTVDDVTDSLLGRGFTADRLHGDLNQTMRERVMRNFRSGTIEVLIATDVAARGIDIEEVDLIVNYELPYDEEDYVHRIGRTGRAGRTGLAVSLVGGKEIFQLQRIQRFTKVKMIRSKVPSQEELEAKRVDHSFEQVKTLLESGQYQKHEPMIERLLEAGHSPTDISSALVDLWIKSNARDAESIQEDLITFNPEGGESKGKKRTPIAADGKTRLFLNVGEMDQVGSGEIAGFLYNETQVPNGCLGAISVFAKCSYFEIDTEQVDQVISNARGKTFGNRNVRIDYATEPTGGGGGGGGRGGPRGDFRGGRPPRRFDRDDRGGRGDDRRPRSGGGGDRGGRSFEKKDYSFKRKKRF
jgi:ATP-dependent RNA helicase DeaD